MIFLVQLPLNYSIGSFWCLCEKPIIHCFYVTTLVAVNFLLRFSEHDNLNVYWGYGLSVLTTLPLQNVAYDSLREALTLGEFNLGKDICFSFLSYGTSVTFPEDLEISVPLRLGLLSELFWTVINF